MAITVRTLSGPEINAQLRHLAQLRIEVFAAYPYLYSGEAAYEAEYIREFAAEAGSVLVAAFDEAQMVGAATASPMSGQKPEFRLPFADRGIDTDRLFYFGESVLQAEYRGQGIGHAFFDLREAAAREAGARACCFAAVQRPGDHPARPAGYRPLDPFWRKRGYAKVDGLTTALEWKETVDGRVTSKPMQFWLREL